MKKRINQAWQKERTYWLGQYEYAFVYAVTDKWIAINSAIIEEWVNNLSVSDFAKITNGRYDAMSIGWYFAYKHGIVKSVADLASTFLTLAFQLAMDENAIHMFVGDFVMRLPAFEAHMPSIRKNCAMIRKVVSVHES